MLPKEVILLQRAGQVILFNIGVLVTQSVLYGLYLAIFVIGIRVLLKRNPRTKYTWILFGLLSILYLLSTTNFALTVTTDVILIRDGLIDNSEKPLTERLGLANKDAHLLQIVAFWSSGGTGNGGGFSFLLADAVVVWRACVLWPGNKVIKAILLTLLFATAGSAIASSTLVTISSLTDNIVAASSLTGVILNLGLGLSLATNAVATILIGCKAYSHRQTMKITGMGRQSSVTGVVLLFLTESGAAFCILQIIVLATDASDNVSLSVHDYVTHILQQLTIFTAAAYPILVIIIVDSRRSISDHAGSSAGDSGFVQGPDAGSLSVESHISFAVRRPGVSSGGGGVGTDSMIISGIDLIDGVDHFDDKGSLRFRDVEKGGGLAMDGSYC